MIPLGDGMIPARDGAPPPVAGADDEEQRRRGAGGLRPGARRRGGVRAVRLVPLAGLAVAWATATVLVARGGGRTTGIQVLLAVLAGAALAGGARWRWPAATTAGVLLLVAAYALGLALRDTLDDAAPVVAGALVAAVLCASWASEAPAARLPRRTPGAGEDPGRLRGLAVVAATLGAVALAALVLEVPAGSSRSLWLQAAGAGAALGLVVALVALSRRGTPPPAPGRPAGDADVPVGPADPAPPRRSP
jgi:hypothetical protein